MPQLNYSKNPSFHTIAPESLFFILCLFHDMNSLSLMAGCQSEFCLQFDRFLCHLLAKCNFTPFIFLVCVKILNLLNKVALQEPSLYMRLTWQWSASLQVAIFNDSKASGPTVLSSSLWATDCFHSCEMEHSKFLLSLKWGAAKRKIFFLQIEKNKQTNILIEK